MKINSVPCCKLPSRLSRVSLTTILAVLIVTLISTNAISIIRVTAHSPVLNPIGDKTVNEGELLTFTVTASDPDGDPVTIGMTAVLPSGATFDPETGVFSWTPSYYHAGEYTAVFWASDGTEEPVDDYEVITITVINVNGPAMWHHIGDKTVNEGELLTFTVTASDPDGDPMTMWATLLPDGAVFAQIDATTGEFTWTPSYDQAGEHIVYFVVMTDFGGDLETVTITVNNVNVPPILDPIGDKMVLEGELLTFTVTAWDPDGDPVNLGTAEVLPAGATFDPATGVFAWTPSSGQAGSYTAWFYANDWGSLGNAEMITITVKTANHPPLWGYIGDKTVNEMELLTFRVTAWDPDGDPMTMWATLLPDGAVFAQIDATNGTFAWTPSYDQAGSYDVTFIVSDSIDDTSETITITVNDVNAPPTLDPIGDKMVLEGELLTFTVTASDRDGDPVTLAAVDLPDGATFNATTGLFSWEPSTDQAGNYPITFEASDGELVASETVKVIVLETAVIVRVQTEEIANVTIIVRDLEADGEIDRTASNTLQSRLDGAGDCATQRLPPDFLGWPTLYPIGDRLGMAGFPIHIPVTASDPDGDPFILSACPLPPGALFDANIGLFVWIPTFDQAGAYEVTFMVSDGSQIRDYETITITVLNWLTSANSEPTVKSQLPSMGKTKIAPPQKPLDKPVNPQIKPITNKLNAIIHYIEAQRGKHISESAADLLISEITTIIDVLQQL